MSDMRWKDTLPRFSPQIAVSVIGPLSHLTRALQYEQKGDIGPMLYSAAQAATGIRNWRAKIEKEYNISSERCSDWDNLSDRQLVNNALLHVVSADTCITEDEVYPSLSVLSLREAEAMLRTLWRRYPTPNEDQF